MIYFLAYSLIAILVVLACRKLSRDIHNAKRELGTKLDAIKGSQYYSTKREQKTWDRVQRIYKRIKR